MGAAGHHGMPVPGRVPCQRRQNRPQLGFDQVEPLADLQDRGGVHDVLRCGAPMGPRAGCPGGFRQTADEPDDRIADITRAGRQILRAQVLDVGGRDDRLGGVRRDDPHAALDPGERGFHVQHALEIRCLVEHRAHGVTAVERAEDRAVGGVNGHGKTSERDRIRRLLSQSAPRRATGPGELATTAAPNTVFREADHI